MRKNIKLTSKKFAKKEQKPRFDGFFFFVEDQGEGAARVIVIILKVIELIMTTIYGLVMGIFGPIILGTSEIFGDEFSGDPVLTFWLIASILYIIGMFVLMLGCSKIASAIHLAALVGTLITHACFLELFRNVTGFNAPSGMYLPCVFITVLTLAVMLLINIPKVIECKIQKDNEIAPSIFDSPTSKKGRK